MLATSVARVAADLDRRLQRSSLALWLLVTLPLLLLYLATLRVNACDMSPDTVAVTGSAWQLAHHGTPRLPLSEPAYHAWLVRSGADHAISNREPGLIVLAALFYRIFPFAGIFDIGPASLAAAAATSCAMGVLALVLSRLVSARAAWLAALIAGVATSTWAVSGTSLWPHGPDQLYLAVAMLALAGGRWWAAGAAFALAIVTRPPLAVAAAVAGLWLAWKGRSWRPLLQIGVISAAGLVAFLWYSHVFWGGGLQSQYTATGDGGDFVGAFNDWRPRALLDFVGRFIGTAIAPGRGVIFGAPFVLVLIPGIRAGWRATPQWARAASAAGLAYLFVQLKANDFGGGATFWSFRYPLEALTLLAPLLALTWREHVAVSPRRRARFAALVSVSVALQFIGATAFRRRANNWWRFDDFRAAFADHPALVVCSAVGGLLIAALVYWRAIQVAPHRGTSVRA